METFTFNPALTKVTTVPVCGDGTVHVEFTATFSSRDAYERARAENLCLEMWTDLPADHNENGWHALRFKYADPSNNASSSDAEAADKGGKLISLAPKASAHTQARDSTLYLDLSLRDVQPGSRFSFTYRLVRSSGTVEWLGAFGQNGEIVFEDRDERLKWADGWTLRGDELVKGRAGSSPEGLVAVLNSEMDWTCWAFGEHGWPSLTATAAAPPSKAILLVPGRSSTSRSVAIPQPLLLSVADGSASLTITEGGHVFANGTTIVKVLDAHKFTADALKALLPPPSQVLELGTNAKCIAVVTPPSEDGSFPMALSLIPLVQREAERIDVALRSSDLQAIAPVVQTSDAVIIDPSTSNFCFVGPHTTEDVTVRVGASGGQLLISPLHALTSGAPDLAPASWKFAMLSPTASAKVETPEHTNTGSPALPTPPPSPPPNMSALRSGAVVTPQPTLALPSFQSFQSLAEALESEPEATVAPPLTPTSPEKDSIALESATAAVDTAAVETAAVETSAETVAVQERPQTLTVPPPSRPPVNNGFLRFFFAWLIRAFLARVWGLMDDGVRWVGLPLPAVVDGEYLQRFEHHDTVEHQEEQAPGVEPAPEAEDNPVEEQEEQASSTPVEATSEGIDVDTEADEVQESAPVIDEAAATTIHQPTAVPFTSPAPPSILPRSKPRFLADVRTNIVSFLVHAPHIHAKPSDLSISVNEKRLEDRDGYSCSQLSGDVYLLGLQGPEGGSTVEVALD